MQYVNWISDWNCKLNYFSFFPSILYTAVILVTLGHVTFPGNLESLVWMPGTWGTPCHMVLCTLNVADCIILQNKGTLCQFCIIQSERKQLVRVMKDLICYLCRIAKFNFCVVSYITTLTTSSLIGRVNKFFPRWTKKRSKTVTWDDRGLWFYADIQCIKTQKIEYSIQFPCNLHKIKANLMDMYYRTSPTSFFYATYF